MLPRDSGTMVKRRLDYRPPAFLIPSIHLEVDLDPAATRVTSVIEFRRNPNAAREDRTSALILDGEQQDDVSIELDGAPVPLEAFTLNERALTIRVVPDAGRLTVRSRLAPAKNFALEGLYVSSGVFCTQCEPEGFRRITY
ncbi:MAG: aminopeptidase N, partial [Betaproteobacteria bacterium]|nr:aminopeptidase N [Betaproteobacteria bacterium]